VGYFADISLELFPNAIVTVTDFDISKKNDPSRSETNKIFLPCDLNVEFPDGKFDLIIAWNILEHVLDPYEFIVNCYNSLNKNGVLLLQTPNFHTLSAKLFKNYYWGGLHAPRHFVLFSEKSLIQNLGKGGFKAFKIKYVQGAHLWSVSLCNFLNIKVKPGGNAIIKFKSYNFFLYIFAILDIAASKITRTGQVQVVARK
jgi:SAM-dependent methyltransferase